MIRRRQWRTRQKNNKSRPRSRNSGRPKPKSARKKGRNTGANKHKSKASGKLKYSGREKAEQEAAKQQPQAETQRALASTPSLSREGIPEHTYELLQDYTVNIGNWRKRLRRGERYHGRILVDHAEIDIDGISYIVPSGILSAPKD